MEGEIHVYTHTSRPRRFLSKLSGKWIRVHAKLKDGKLELKALSGGDQYTKTISLDEATACSVQKCYGRANCIIVTGFNRSPTTKRVFDCLTPEARNKWQAAFVRASTARAPRARSAAHSEGSRQVVLRADFSRVARSKLRQKTRTLESFMLWYEEFHRSPLYKVSSRAKRRWWKAMFSVARAVFREREERYGYTSLELIKLQKKLTDIDVRTMSEIKRKARRIIHEFIMARANNDAMAKWGEIVVNGAKSQGIAVGPLPASTSALDRPKGFLESSFRKDLQNLLRRERVLTKLTRTLELIRRKERHSFVLADAMRGLWVARCVRALLNLPGGLAAVLAMPQERGSLRRLLAAAMLCRVPLLTTLVLEMLAALALLPGREGHGVTLNVLAQVDKSAKWGHPICSDYLMRASPEALKWSNAAPRNPPPLSAIATLLHDTPEHNCVPELRSAVVNLFGALCRSEPTRSAAQWTQAKIFHACRAAINVSTAGSRQACVSVKASYGSLADGPLAGETMNEALLRVRRRRSSIVSERAPTEEPVEEEAAASIGVQATTVLHPCPPLRALLTAPTEPRGEDYEDGCERLFKIQLEHFLDGWDHRELDEADECDSLAIGSAERIELLCERVQRSALLLGRYVNVDEALHAFGIDLEHAAFTPIHKLAPKAFIDDSHKEEAYGDGRRLSLDMNATINSICKLHRSSICAGPGVHRLISSLQRDGSLVVNDDGGPLLKGLLPGSPASSVGLKQLGSPHLSSASGQNKKPQKVVVNRGPPLKDDPKYSKYFKMIKMHVPKLAVEGKMAQDGLDPAILELDPNAPAPREDSESDETASRTSEIALENDPVYSKYFKMLRLHVPRGNVEHKMRIEGLDPAVLDFDPGEPVPPYLKQSSSGERTPPPPSAIDEEAEDKFEAEGLNAAPPPGCTRVPRHRLRRVFWDVVESAEGTMWEETMKAADAAAETNGERPFNSVLFLSNEGLEELEMIFGTTSRRSSLSKADACEEAAAAKKHKFEKDLRQSTQLDADGVNRDSPRSRQGRALVAEALGEKRAFALNLLYGSLRLANEECVAAVATLDPDDSVFVSKLPRLGTLYNLISRKEDLASIETKAIDTGILDESTRSLAGGGTIESKGLDRLSSLMVSLIERARRPRAKVQALWLYATVRDRASELMTSIRNFEAAAEAVRRSDLLKKLFRVVLSITNFVNHGSEHGNKCGVRLAALAKLQTTRTTKVETTCKNLLQFVVRHAGVPAADLKKEIPPSVLRTVHTGATRAAISHGIDQLRSERDEAVAERGVLSREATTQAPGVDARRVAFSATAAARMANLVADVDDELGGLDTSFADMDTMVDDTLRYYGEPLDVGGGEAVDWFRTLDTFIGQFDAEYSEWLDHLARRERREQLARKKLAREQILQNEQPNELDPVGSSTATGLMQPPTSPTSDAAHNPRPFELSENIRKSLKEFDRLVDDAARGALSLAEEHQIIICAQCKACNASTTPGAYTNGPDHSWYCADCWYEFSFHNTDWKDSFGEETVPVISNE